MRSFDAEAIQLRLPWPRMIAALEEALRAATLGNAYLTFEEKIKGSIETGKLGDFVVLPEDLLSCPPKDIENMKVQMTVVGGKVVFDREAR